LSKEIKSFYRFHLGVSLCETPKQNPVGILQPSLNCFLSQLFVK